MAKTVVELANERTLAQAEQTRNVEQIEGWEGTVRADIAVFKKGDTFTVNGDEPIFKQTMGERNGKPVYAYFINVEVTEANGAKVAKSLYSGTLTKSAMEYDKSTHDGIKMHSTTGTASTEYRKHVQIADAMAAIKGKAIKVTADKEIVTRRFGTDGDKASDYVTTHIFTFDFVA